MGPLKGTRLWLREKMFGSYDNSTFHTLDIILDMFCLGPGADAFKARKTVSKSEANEL